MALVCAAMFQALYFVLQKPLLTKYGPFAVVCYAVWAGTLAMLPFARNLTGALATEWAQLAPTDATRWLEKLPAGKTRDRAVVNFAQQLSSSDPVTAMKWAETVQDESQWQGATEEVAQNWRRIDEAAAKTWVAKSSLPEDFKKQFAENEQ